MASREEATDPDSRRVSPTSQYGGSCEERKFRKRAEPSRLFDRARQGQVSASRLRVKERANDHIFPQITWRDLGPVTSLQFSRGRLWATGPQGSASLVCNPLPPRRARKLRNALANYGWIVDDSDPAAP